MKIIPTKPQVFPTESSDRSANAKEKEKLKEVSKSFEALFINHMIGEMRKTVNKSGFIPEGAGEKIYRGMLDQEYAKSISEKDELGISKLVYDHLLRINRLE